MSRTTRIFPVTCSKCGHGGTLAFWYEGAHWGVTWSGFRGAEALPSMPRRARGMCLSCKSRLILVGEPLAAG
jgi:hypothetical protein